MKVSAVALVSTPTVDADGDGTNDTYKPGDTVRARVTFNSAVDVTGSPVLKLQFAESSGEKTMTFDTARSRTNTTTLEFTYTVAAGNLSTQGIAFLADKLSVGPGASILGAQAGQLSGTAVDLSFAKVDHDPGHKVDGVKPRLAATNTISVTSSPGTDGTYGIGDVIDVTVRFNEAVTVTTLGNPVTDPNLQVAVGVENDFNDWNSVPYHSGSGTTDLVFRYTVKEGDVDADGISVPANAIALGPPGRSSKIADAAGNEAGFSQLQNSRSGRFTNHKVDGKRATVTSAAVRDSTLTITFNEALGAAANLANAAFTVEKTPAGGSERTVSLSGTPSISGAAVTLTLASAIVETDTDVKVSYAAPTTGTDNKLVDAAGNAVESFTDRRVASDTFAPTVRDAWVNGSTLTLTFGEPLDTAAAPAPGAFTISGTTAATTVTKVAFKSGDATKVELTLNPAVGSGESSVTVSYSRPAANPLKDASGNRVANFSETVNTNAAPGFPSNAPATLSVEENSAAGAAVGAVAATDPDGDALTYTLDSASAEAFAIDGDGAITVAGAVALDHEAKPSWSVTVSVSDGKASDGTADPAVDATHSLTINVADVGEPPGAPPTAVEVTGTSNTSVRVSWTAPPAETDRPAVTGYDLRWFEGASDPDLDSQWSTRALEEAATSTTITGLHAGSTYRVQVRAKNADGGGPWSDSGSGSTTVLVPANCDADSTTTQDWIASVTSTSRSITVTLNDPPQGGGISINICRVRGTFGQQIFSIGEPAAGSHTITNWGINNRGPALEPDTDYWVRVSGQYNDNYSVWHHIRTKSADWTPVPALTALAASSSGPYAIGDVIALKATFNVAVTVDTTGGTPRIPFTLGTATKHAAYALGQRHDGPGVPLHGGRGRRGQRRHHGRAERAGAQRRDHRRRILERGDARPRGGGGERRATPSTRCARRCRAPRFRGRR